MPLTSAERCRRYREKLKEADPQKFEEMKKRNAERTKAKKRKIESMNEEEKEVVRKQWRNAKRNKKQSTEEELTALVKESSRRRYRSQVARENLKLKGQVNKLSLKNVNLRKTLIRYRKRNRILTEELNRQQSEKEAMIVPPSENHQETHIKQLNELTPKTKSYFFIKEELPNISKEAKQKVKQKLLVQHVLEESLKETYQDSKTFKEKKIFKKIVESESVKRYNMQTKLTNFLGLKKIRSYQTIKQKRMKTAKKIKEFFERDDVSRMTAGKRECVTRKKNKKQKRFLLNTLPKLYKVYINEGGTLSFTTFKRYRPFYIVSPKIGDRNTCVCIKHANLAFKAESLKKLGLIPTCDLNYLVSEIVCDVKSKSCMYSECRVCSGKNLCINMPTESQEDVSWFEWTTKAHEFEKSGERKVTKKTCKEKRTGSVTTLSNLLQDDLIKFKEHHFNIYNQYKKYKEAIEKIQDNEAIIHCDFSENYGCKMAEEVQALHFGASKQQITLHTGVAYIKYEKPLSFCTISPSLKHDPEAIWAHLEPILKYLKEKYPRIDRVHFHSDGPTTQYRQKKNFFLFSEKTKEAGFHQATWSFFEASHGKGAADGVGGAIKRTLDRRVTYGDDIIDAKSAFEALSKTETTVKTFYVTEQNIEDIKISNPERIQPIPLTMKLHQIIATEDKNVIKYRPLSCFCSRGNCDCFSTKSHILKTTKHFKNKGKTSKEDKKETRKTKKILDSCSENTDTEVQYAESYIDTDWNNAESTVINEYKEAEIKMKTERAKRKQNVIKKNTDEKITKEIEEANQIRNVVEIRKENKETKKRNEVVKILSEIQNTPENKRYFDLNSFGPLSLKAIGMDITLGSSKSKETSRIYTSDDNKEIYNNNMSSEQNVNEYNKEQVEMCENYDGELRETEEQEWTIAEKKRVVELEDGFNKDKLGSELNEHTVSGTKEQKMTIGEREKCIELEDEFYKDELGSMPDEQRVRETEEQKRTTGGIEIGEEFDDGVNKDEFGSVPGQHSDRFLINDEVLVRYYQRKQWKHFIGFIQNIESKDNETFYIIRFLKTIKKPELKFIHPKKKDLDIVTNISIVKKIQMCHDLQSKEYYLGDSCDEIYF